MFVTFQPAPDAAGSEAVGHVGAVVVVSLVEQPAERGGGGPVARAGGRGRGQGHRGPRRPARLLPRLRRLPLHLRAQQRQLVDLLSSLPGRNREQFGGLQLERAMQLSSGSKTLEESL